MNFFYYLLRGGGFLIAQIPLFLLYPFSGFLAWIASDLVRYRRDVVLANLKASFPEKSDRERLKIAKGFYLNFTDIMVNRLKCYSLNPRLIPSRVKVLNSELLNLINKQKHHCCIGTLLGIWEWMGVGLKAVTGMRALVTYKPLSSKLMDRLMKEIRQLNGSE